MQDGLKMWVCLRKKEFLFILNNFSIFWDVLLKLMKLLKLIHQMEHNNKMSTVETQTKPPFTSYNPKYMQSLYLFHF